jgi:hypothetical protein
MKRWLPGFVVAIFLVYVAVAIFPPISSAGGFDARRFGRLPVWLNGRVQPIDSAARVALLQIHGTATLPVPEDASSSSHLWTRTPRLEAAEWLLEVLTRPAAADSRKLFVITDPAIRAVAVEGAPADTTLVYYASRELQPRVKEIGERVARAWKVKPADRTSSDRRWLELRDDLVLYERLKNTLQPNSFLQGEAAGKPIDYDFAAQLARYEADLRAAIAARREGKKDVFDKDTEERVVAFVRPYVGVSKAALLSLVPPSDPARGRDRWLTAGAALVGSSRTATFPAPLSYFARMSTAYRNRKADDFNRELAGYEQWLAARGLTPEVRRARTEFFYNAFQPFVRALAIYLIVLVVGAGAMIGRSPTLYRCAALLLTLGATLHATGMLFDAMLQGTLPVTNAYSALIAAGAMGVLVGAGVERRYRNGVGLMAAAVIGLGTVAAAHGLAPGGARALALELFDARFGLAVAISSLALAFGLRPPRASLQAPVHLRGARRIPSLRLRAVAKTAFGSWRA